MNPVLFTKWKKPLVIKVSLFFIESKEQKFNRYIKEFKNKTLHKYYLGRGWFTSLSNEYNVPTQTIKRWDYNINHPKVNI